MEISIYRVYVHSYRWKSPVIGMNGYKNEN